MPVEFATCFLYGNKSEGFLIKTLTKAWSFCSLEYKSKERTWNGVCTENLGLFASSYLPFPESVFCDWETPKLFSKSKSWFKSN